jgi:hypothetical protein
MIRRFEVRLLVAQFLCGGQPCSAHEARQRSSLQLAVRRNGSSGKKLCGCSRGKINSCLQVQQLFPHIPISTITSDLRVTRSVEITIENVLDGRLVAPAMYREPEVVPSANRSMSVLQTNCDTETQQQRNWDEFSTETVET